VSRALLVAALVLAGCGSPAPEAGSGGAPSPSPSASPAYRYTCGQYPFDLATLEATGDVESEDSDLGRALRDLFETFEGKYLKQAEGWHVVYEDDERAELVARMPGAPFVSATFERAGDAWRHVGFGDCQPRVVVGDRSPVTWELAEKPSADDTELAVEAGDIACSSGRKLTPANTRVEVEYTEDAISILIHGTPHMGGDCVGAAWPLTVTLDEPVGDRELLDAAYYPPRRRHPR
jgi:hypothetical protein